MENNPRRLQLPPPFPDNLDHLIAVPRPRRVDFLPEVVDLVHPVNIAEERARAAAVGRARVAAAREAAINREAAVNRVRAEVARQATIDRESSGEEKSYEPDDKVRKVIQMGGSKRRRKHRKITRRRRTIRRRTSTRRSSRRRRK